MAELKMPDLNSVMIAGNLTSDPSFRRTSNGTPVANFYIASNRRFKDNTGQWRENVCYVGVVAWYKLAESCAENLHKGSAVLVDGELQSRIWKNEDGTTRNVVEIKARRIQFLNKRAEATEMSSAEDEYQHEHASGDEPERNVHTNADKPVSAETPPPSEPKHEFNFGYDNLKL